MKKLGNRKFLWDVEVTFLKDRSSAHEEPSRYTQYAFATAKELDRIIDIIEQAHLASGGSVVETKVTRQS